MAARAIKKEETVKTVFRSTQREETEGSGQSEKWLGRERTWK